MFKIEKISDANTIIEFSEKNGLQDVKLWTNIEKIQSQLNTGECVAYIAKISNEQSLNFLIGAIIGAFEEEGRIWIELLTIAKQYRKKGIGHALLNELCKKNNKKGFRACFVDVDGDNNGAIKFYKHVGFKQVGMINNYYYDDTQALIFMKKL